MELELILEGLELAIQEEPKLAAEITNLLTKTDATPEDWAALRVRSRSKSYRDLVPNSGLPAETAAAPAPASDTASPAATASTSVNAPTA